MITLERNNQPKADDRSKIIMACGMNDWTSRMIELDISDIQKHLSVKLYGLAFLSHCSRLSICAKPPS